MILFEINFLFVVNKKARDLSFPCLLLVFDTFTVLLCVQSLFDISNDIIRIFDTYR